MEGTNLPAGVPYVARLESKDAEAVASSVCPPPYSPSSSSFLVATKETSM